MSTEVPAALSPIPGSVPFIHNADTAPAYWMADVLWMVLADGNDTGGRFSLMEQLLPKGSGPGPHKHTWSDETFYMLDGEITLLVGDEIRTARKGDFIMVPRDTRHAFRVDSENALPQRLHAREHGSAGHGAGNAGDPACPPAQEHGAAASDELRLAWAVWHGCPARPGPAAPRRTLSLPGAGLASWPAPDQ